MKSLDKKLMNWELNQNKTGTISNYPIFLEPIDINEIFHKKKNDVAYLHIPFCNSICSFCCYNHKKGVINNKIEDKYLKAINKEVLLKKRTLSKQNNDIRAFFIGGGTPTAIQANKLIPIIETISKELEITNQTQVSLETNPSVSKIEEMILFKNAGINRISFGLQSINDKYLQLFNCPHSYKDFLKAYENVKSVGICNVNVDLLYKLPGQTMMSRFVKTKNQKVLSITLQI